MKNKLVILICACFLASCASAPTRIPVRDRFGILEIDITADYVDDTKSYLQDIRTISLKLGKPERPGIKSLLMIRRNDGNANCQFKELRLFEYDAAYKWETERLATEISISRSRTYANLEMRDYMQLGLAAPMVGNNTKQTELVSSTALSMSALSGWQTTYSHKIVEEGRVRRGAILSKTIVIKASSAEAYEEQKKYVVAECAAGAVNFDRATIVLDQITALMNSMRILSDFPPVK